MVGNREARHPTTHQQSGAAYVFDLDAQGNWVERFRLWKSTGNHVPSDFGISAALGEDMALVGDKNHPVLGPWGREGAAFAFDLPFGEAVCSGMPNSTGAAATLEVLGSRRIESELLRLRADGLIPGLLGLFLIADANAFVPGAGGSQGALCLGGRIGRFNAPGMYGLADGTGRFERTWNHETLPMNPPEPILPGQTWYFQCWYRDLGQGGASNFSAAVAVTFE